MRPCQGRDRGFESRHPRHKRAFCSDAGGSLILRHRVETGLADTHSWCIGCTRLIRHISLRRIPGVVTLVVISLRNLRQSRRLVGEQVS